MAAKTPKVQDPPNHFTKEWIDEADKKTHVYVWVRLAPSEPAVPNMNILHMIWKGATTYLEIDTYVSDPKTIPNGFHLDIKQMPAPMRKPDVRDWINTPEGIAWRDSCPVQLIETIIDGK